MITYDAITSKGSREKNEDYVGMKEKNQNKLFVLCDGLGGHEGGEVASQLVVESLINSFSSTNENQEWIEQAVLNAQSALLNKQEELHDQNGMKTTMTLLEITENEFQVCFVGDSRIYYFQKNRFKSRTLDHSVPQMLVNSHKMKESEIRNHPDRNRLLRVMGIEWNEPKYELLKRQKMSSRTQDAFLLCSDGFWELITEKEMEHELKFSKNVNEWLSNMEKIVQEHGKDKNMDNYSAIGVWVNG